MKRKEEKNGLEDGRRRWFNQEIESTRNEIQELIQELEQRGA